MKRQKEIDERIENAKMRVIKWEKIWNDYRKKINGERERERERERATHDTMTTSRIVFFFFNKWAFYWIIWSFVIVWLCLFFFCLNYFWYYLSSFLLLLLDHLLFMFVQGVKDHIWGQRFIFLVKCSVTSTIF